MPGLPTEVQQAKTDNIHIFNTVRTRDRHKGDIIIIITRRDDTKDSNGAGWRMSRVFRGRNDGSRGEGFGEQNLKLQKGSLKEERTQQHQVFKCLCGKNSTGH